MTTEAILVDTSVAIAHLFPEHDFHERVRTALRGIPLLLAPHSLAETYSVLTRLPGDGRVAPADAAALIDAEFEVVALPTEVQTSVHRTLSAAGVAGGAVYDALVAIAAREGDLPLATCDARALATYAALGVRVLLITPESR